MLAGWHRRVRVATILAVSVPAAVVALSLNAMAASPSPGASGAPAVAGDPAKGQQVYNANCTSCHGANLEGSSIGPKLNPLTKLSGVDNPKDPDYLTQSLVAGRPAGDGFPGAMPAWKGKLSDSDIQNLVAFILDANSKGAGGNFTPAELARSDVFWVSVGIGSLVLLTYLLAVYNMRWIARRAAARRNR